MLVLYVKLSDTNTFGLEKLKKTIYLEQYTYIDKKSFEMLLSFCSVVIFAYRG